MLGDLLWGSPWENNKMDAAYTCTRFMHRHKFQYTPFMVDVHKKNSRFENTNLSKKWVSSYTCTLHGINV